jgi:hypothetical protein
LHVPPEQLALPSIRGSAEAEVVKIGVAINKLKLDRATMAKAKTIDFTLFLPEI